MSVEDWAEIRRLHRSEGMPIKAIARVLGVGRNTVRRALAAEGPPKYQRPRTGSKVDAVEPQIRELLQAYPRMPATVIAERIGWAYGITILKDRIRELRPLYLPPDPSGRTQYLAGELAQCDLWFPPVDIPLGHGQTGRPPVLVMVTGYSRMITAMMLPSRQSPDLLCGHWELLRGWGVVPRALVWDNESAIGKWRAGKPELTTAMNGFRGMLGIKVVLCRPADPEAKGLVERANGYLETSFLPGRSFSSPADFNKQLTTWLVVANARTGMPANRSLGRRLGSDGGVATCTAGGRLDDHGAAGQGPLRAVGRQRLLGASLGNRPQGHRHRRPAHGAHPLRRGPRRRAPALLGIAPNDQRSHPRHRRGTVAHSALAGHRDTAR